MKKYNRKDIDNTELCHEYWDLNASTAELGKKHHCSPETIANRLRDMGVGVRSNGDAHKGIPSADKLTSRREKYYPNVKRLYEIDKQWLEDRYIKDRCSLVELGKEIGCTDVTIKKRLREFGIPIRNISEAKKGRKLSAEALDSCREKRLLQPSKQQFKMTKDELVEKYVVQNKSMSDIAKEYGCSCVLVSQRLAKFNIQSRNAVDAHKTDSYNGKISQVWIDKKGEDYYKLPEGKPEVGQLVDGKEIGKRFAHIWHACSNCGKERWVAVNNLKNSKTGGLCFKCTPKDEKVRKKFTDGLNRRYEDPKEREKTSDATRLRWASDDEAREKHGDFLREMLKRPDVKEKQSYHSRLFWDDPIYGEERRKTNGDRFSGIVKGLWENPEYREQMVEMQRNLWADSAYKDKQAKAMREGAKARPTKPEASTIDILNSLYPNEWKYVGDGSIVIEGRNPDIINVNGRKAIIEVFGDYWHGLKNTKECPLLHEMERIDLYAKYGYKTLIIWEHELKDEGSAVKKIKEFCAIMGLHNEIQISL